MTRALLAAVLALVACVPQAVAAAEFVRADAPRVAPDDAAATRAAAAITEFSAQLYAELARHDGNLVVSPYSIAAALAMARDGAAGATRREIEKVLRVPTAGDLDVAFNSLDQVLAKRNATYKLGDKSVPLELGTANQLFAQKDEQFVQAYLDLLARYYGTGVAIVDYVNAREQARRTINAWVSDRTKSRIPELIKDGVLNDLTRLVLVNAIYFKGKWLEPFEKTLTASAPFHRLDGTSVSAALMHYASTSVNVLYTRGDAFQSVSLPYITGISMVLVVPDAGSFRAVEASLSDAAKLRAATELSRRTAVALALPKFQFRTNVMLKSVLAQLGMPLAFDEHNADFTGISTRDRLVIQDVVHEAFISVDEDGTEAAAATAVVFRSVSAPLEVVELTVDRPFLFAIRDDATGAILFMGRVLDPTGT